MTQSRPNMALIAALMAGLALPAAAQQRPEPRPGDDAPAAQAKAPQAPLTFGLAGPYLAARMATVENDFGAAARYFVQAVAHDPSDRYLQDSALVSLVSAGEIDRAVKLSDQIATEGDPTELSGLIQRAALAHGGDWQGLLDSLANKPTGAAIESDLLDGMLEAWGLLGAGRAQEALQKFEDMAKARSVAPMVNYHLALARAMVGDYEGADSLLADPATGAHLLGFTARAEILTQLDRRDEAVAMLDSLEGIEAEPQLLALRNRIADGEPVSFDVVKTAADGIAQVFLTLATALASSPEPEPLSLIYSRLAVWLSPDSAEARLMMAQLLQEREQFHLAEPEFEALRRMGQMRPIAELARIDALSRADHRDEAEKAALALTAAYPDLPQAWMALGDLLRQQEKFNKAVPAYDKALALLEDQPPEAKWFPLYARGIALERAGQFERAEQDLLAAIEIRPDQASLLNYLGYSWIDRNENLDRGLEMIQKAVELSPDDGYIQDSLAWAYFRLGRFEEAVEPMERAIGTMSQDPLVNDHLGDIYWMVGRHREAEIQWKRALSLEPTDAGDVDADRVRAKLERGLDAVLAEEKASGNQPKGSAPIAEPQASNHN
ncbi:tetratricopeptide repeat protein [Paracoccus fistulariae]|uniref:tetratricopeptide repeat protein n=1 Tax=Paracoccus fistulariae TaxID=658446 RepID=UPI0023505335|nr:tetratricopeptide repeat protein [Paracoccus fistulariae]